jgi:antitoxin component of RelBE/YafQ-DinJ toxin-antitoxin module
VNKNAFLHIRVNPYAKQHWIKTADKANLSLSRLVEIAMNEITNYKEDK